METESTASSPKQISESEETIEIEFDGNTVLCRVCGDRASGFHYGVHACEGCKGFFRRSIQQKIQYRPCLKNQLCLITRVNRNRCQYCRLKKCIAVGMSRDAVRFGRVPKREKAKIMEQMQKVNIQCHGSMLEAILNNEAELRRQVVEAHMKTCEFTRANFEKFYKKAWSQPEIVHCPAHMVCPFNPFPDAQNDAHKWDQFSDCFMPAIRNVVSFAKCIPGFSVLSQEDQVTLLKAGTFEVLLVHLACLFDSKNNTMLFTNGKIFRRTSLSFNTGAGYLLDSMFDFAERFNELNLTDDEVALFSALVIISSDRPGLRGVDLVEKLQASITRSLQLQMKANHHDDQSVFAKLLVKVSELRMLNTVHSEKLLGLSVPSLDPQHPNTFPVSSSFHGSNQMHLCFGAGCRGLDGRSVDARGSSFEFSDNLKSEDCQPSVEVIDLRGRAGGFARGSSQWSKGQLYGGAGDSDQRSGDAKSKVAHSDFDGHLRRNSVTSKILGESSWVSTGSANSSFDEKHRLSPHPSIVTSHSAALSSANASLTAHPSGSSIVAHQVMMKTVQQELILTTPVGTFHRMPLNLWTAAAAGAAAVATSNGPKRKLNESGENFQMDVEEGNFEGRRPWKVVKEADNIDDNIVVDKSVIPTKKKVMRTWSEDTASSKLSCSSCCSDSNMEVEALPMRSMRQVREQMEDALPRSSPNYPSANSDNTGCAKPSRCPSSVDLPALKTALSTNVAYSSSGQLLNRQKAGNIQGTSTASSVGGGGDEEFQGCCLGDQFIGKQCPSACGMSYMNAGHQVGTKTDQYRSVFRSSMASPVKDISRTDVDRMPRSSQLLSSFAAENLLKPSQTATRIKIGLPETTDRDVHLTTKATLKERLLKRIDSKDNVNVSDPIEAGGSGMLQSSVGVEPVMPPLDALNPAFPLQFLSEYPHFYPLSFPTGFHPGVLYNHLALQHLHAMQHQQHQKQLQVQVHLNQAMLGMRPKTGESSPILNSATVHSTGSPLVQSNSSEHLSLDGSSEFEEIKHLKTPAEHLAHQSSLLLKSETV